MSEKTKKKRTLKGCGHMASFLHVKAAYYSNMELPLWQWFPLCTQQSPQGFDILA